MAKKRRPRRSDVKYPAFDPKYNPKVNSEYYDIDYLNQLSEEEKKWLHDFEEEYMNAAVGKQSAAKKNKHHKTVELVKDCTDRKNSRNRCMYGIAKASGLVSDDPRVDVDTAPTNAGLTEDALIAQIDRDNEEKD